MQIQAEKSQKKLRPRTDEPTVNGAICLRDAKNQTETEMPRMAAVAIICAALQSTLPQKDISPVVLLA